MPGTLYLPLCHIRIPAPHIPLETGYKATVLEGCNTTLSLICALQTAPHLPSNASNNDEQSGVLHSVESAILLQTEPTWSSVGRRCCIILGLEARGCWQGRCP